MTPEPTRRFTLLDATILIAATAIGMATARAAGWMPKSSPMRGWPHDAGQALAWVRFGWYFLVAWGPALVTLGMRTPRGRPGGEWRRPGMVACVALTAALIVQAIPPLILIATIGAQDALARGFLRQMTWQADDYGARATCAVAGSWAALILAGQWRADRGWLDRAGRFVGVAWVASYALDQALLVSIGLQP